MIGLTPAGEKAVLDLLVAVLKLGNIMYQPKPGGGTLSVVATQYVVSSGYTVSC